MTRELNRQVALIIFGRTLAEMCETFRLNRCDGIKRIICGACGGAGHGNCFGRAATVLATTPQSRGGEVQILCENDCRAPDWSGKIEDAFELEEVIIERGLILPYVEFLSSLVGSTEVSTEMSPDDANTWLFKLCHASPHHRAQAAVQAVNAFKTAESISQKLEAGPPEPQEPAERLIWTCEKCNQANRKGSEVCIACGAPKTDLVQPINQQKPVDKCPYCEAELVGHRSESTLDLAYACGSIYRLTPEADSAGFWVKRCDAACTISPAEASGEALNG